mgnify:CR=1 FL=1
MQRRNNTGDPPKDEPRAYSKPVTPEESRDSLFDELSPESPGDWALSLSMPADAGHRDELRDGDDPQTLAPHWASFFDHVGTDGLADLNRRADNLQRQIRDAYAPLRPPPRGTAPANDPKDGATALPPLKGAPRLPSTETLLPGLVPPAGRPDGRTDGNE